MFTDLKIRSLLPMRTPTSLACKNYFFLKKKKRYTVNNKAVSDYKDVPVTLRAIFL